MGNELGTSSMDMELGYEEEEKKEMTEIESEEEEDEIEELEEMTSPRISCRIGADGKKHHEIVVGIYDDLNGFKNRLEMIDPCSICFLPFSTQGNHRICCLPCGHLYGFSCIKKWLQTSSGGKCPQCKTSCAYKDVIRLYASRASAYQKVNVIDLFVKN
ncbi:zinc finger, RING/FYVE/PHD-type containing protein [Tanacetum coccineum]